MSFDSIYVGRYTLLRLEGAIKMLERKSADPRSSWTPEEQLQLDVLQRELENMRRDGRTEYLFDMPADCRGVIDVVCMKCGADLGTQPAHNPALHRTTTRGLCHNCGAVEDKQGQIIQFDLTRRRTGEA